MYGIYCELKIGWEKKNSMDLAVAIAIL